jgi:hypothetical protein
MLRLQESILNSDPQDERRHGTGYDRTLLSSPQRGLLIITRACKPQYVHRIELPSTIRRSSAFNRYSICRQMLTLRSQPLTNCPYMKHVIPQHGGHIVQPLQQPWKTPKTGGYGQDRHKIGGMRLHFLSSKPDRH